MDKYKKAVKRLGRVEQELNKRAATPVRTKRAKASFEELFQEKLRLRDFIDSYKPPVTPPKKARKPRITLNEKLIIRALNFVGEYNGIMPDEYDRIAILEGGIKEFISEKKHDLFEVIEKDGIVKIIKK